MKRFTLDQAIAHAERGVPWCERMAHERWKKNISSESPVVTPKKRKIPSESATVEKKKSRPKREAVLKEEERRRLDGRAEAVATVDMRKALSIYEDGAKKPSTPEEIGKLLAEATK